MPTPDFVPTGITISDGTPKWGLVTLATPDGIVTREYTVSGDAIYAFQSDPKQSIPGLTPEESQLITDSKLTAYTGAMPNNVGNGFKNPDGTLVVNYGIVPDDKRILINRYHVPPKGWEINDGVVFMAPDIAAIVDVPHKVVSSESVNGSLEK